MAVNQINGHTAVEAVREAVEHHGAKYEELIPILNDVNKSLGYLPGEALSEISRLLHVPKSQLFSVSSFYRMLNTHPQGRHVIQFCESAPCHVVGGRQILQQLRDQLQIGANETTPDGKWTLVMTSCLGLCSVGPVITIDDDVFGNITPDQIPEILARYS